jgi:hypothetical protein
MSARNPRAPGAPPKGPPDEVEAGAPDSSPAETSVGQPHDAMFRQAFGDPANAAAVLKSILPSRVAAHIDWDTPFEPVHASMVNMNAQQNAQQRHADMLFKVELVGGRGAFLWVIWEHQSSVYRWMPLRLSGMVQGFLDEWHGRNPRARYLPAVLPVVFHHGPRPWRAPTSLLALMDLSEQQRADFAAHLLSLDFVLDDLRTVPDEAIDARPLSPLLRLILGLMKHARSPDLLAFYVAHADDVRELLATEHGRRSLVISMRYTERVNRNLERDTLLRHLAPLVGPGLEDHMLNFEQLLRKEEFEKGVEKGIEEGVEKGQRELLMRQLTRRFGSLPAAIAGRVAQAGVAELERWGDRILDAASLDDVFTSS